MNQNAEELVKVLVDTVKETKQFVVEQAPDVLKQFLAWNTFKCELGIVISAIFLIICIIVTFFIVKKYRQQSGFDRIGIESYLVTILLVLTCAIIGLIVNSVELYKILHFPKLFLLESLKYLVR